MTRMNGVATKLSKVESIHYIILADSVPLTLLFPLSQCGFLINTNTLVLSLLQIETV